MESNRSSITPVVGFIDVDSFECQLWLREFPQFRKTPCVVANKSGRIMSVTHEAKLLGISRILTPYVEEAVVKCPSLHIFTKPTRFGKPDSSRTRKGTIEFYGAVVKYLTDYGLKRIQIELVGNDELFVDLTEDVSRMIEESRGTGCCVPSAIHIPDKVIFEDKKKSYVGPTQFPLRKEGLCRSNHLSWSQHEKERLIIGGQIMSCLSTHISEFLSLSTSSGVGSNKLLSKLGCSLHKPGFVTILNEDSFSRVSSQLTISNIPGLGGPIGQKLAQNFNIETISELRHVKIQVLSDYFVSERMKVEMERKDKEMSEKKANNTNAVTHDVVDGIISGGKETNGASIDESTTNNSPNISESVEEATSNNENSTVEITTNDSNASDKFEGAVNCAKSLAESIYSYVRGKDHRAVISKHLRDSMRLNKPNNYVYKWETLKNVVSNLCYELDENLSEERSLNRRVPSSVKFDIFYDSSRVENEGFKLSNSYSPPIGSWTSPKDLYAKTIKHLIQCAPSFKTNDFRVTDLYITVKEFRPMDKLIVNRSLGMDCVDSSPPPSTLRVLVDTKNCPIYSLENITQLGSYSTRLNKLYKPRMTYSPVPVLLDENKYSCLIGSQLSSGYHSNFYHIVDRVGYLALKHSFFSQWLFNTYRKKGNRKINEGGNGDSKVDFVSFSGRYGSILLTPIAQQFGDWEIYAINLGGVIYLWDEKKSIWTNHNYYFGLKFQHLLTKDSALNVVEFNKSYVISKSELGSHKLISCCEMDGMDENGTNIEVSCWKQTEDEHSVRQKYKKLWSRNVVDGVNKFIIGTREERGKLIKISQLNMNYVKNQKSDPNVVKKFSWVCGNKYVVCNEVPKSQNKRLYVPNIYTPKVLNLFNQQAQTNQL